MIEYHYHAAAVLAAARRDSLLAQERASRLAEQALSHRRRSGASATRRSLRRAVTASWTAMAGAGARAPRVGRTLTAGTEPLARMNCDNGHAETTTLIVQPIE